MLIARAKLRASPERKRSISGWNSWFNLSV
jgi:hypothetical protein